MLSSWDLVQPNLLIFESFLITIRNWNNSFLFFRSLLIKRKKINLRHTHRYVDAGNRLAVRREFIEILDVGQEQIPTDCRFQASSSFFTLSSYDGTLYSKSSSWDEYRTVFRYFRLLDCDFFFSSYCPRDLYRRHGGAISTIPPLRHSFLLLSGFTKPGEFLTEAEWRLLTSRLSDPCTTTGHDTTFKLVRPHARR